MRFVYGSRVYTLYFQSSTGCPVASPQTDGAVEYVGMTGAYHELALWRSHLRVNARSETKPFSRNLHRSRAGIPSSVSLGCISLW